MSWIVQRHSGRDNAPPRDLHFANEERARKRFEKIKAELRQGEVKLLNPAGEVVDSCWAPRLRTRW